MGLDRIELMVTAERYLDVLTPRVPEGRVLTDGPQRELVNSSIGKPG
jgi:hypothetical protein